MPMLEFAESMIFPLNDFWTVVNSNVQIRKLYDVVIGSWLHACVCVQVQTPLQERDFLLDTQSWKKIAPDYQARLTTDGQLELQIRRH